MGSIIEINDTLRLTKAQGFPAELDYEKHLLKPFKTDSFVNKVFEFKNKANVRLYQLPPIRNFLVESIDTAWLYWGLCQIIEIKHDYVNKTTSGKFKITHINSPEEMKIAFNLIDQVERNNFFL